jgi:hypothetical protein
LPFKKAIGRDKTATIGKIFLERVFFSERLGATIYESVALYPRQLDAPGERIMLRGSVLRMTGSF